SASALIASLWLRALLRAMGHMVRGSIRTATSSALACACRACSQSSQVRHHLLRDGLAEGTAQSGLSGEGAGLHHALRVPLNRTGLKGPASASPALGPGASRPPDRALASLGFGLTGLQDE